MQSVNQETLNFLAIASYVFAFFAIIRVFGRSLAAGRFNIRDLLYVTAIVAATTAIIVAAWFRPRA
jgi:hypothetical protein